MLSPWWRVSGPRMGKDGQGKCQGSMCVGAGWSKTSSSDRAIYVLTKIGGLFDVLADDRSWLALLTTPQTPESMIPDTPSFAPSKPWQTVTLPFTTICCVSVAFHHDSAPSVRLLRPLSRFASTTCSGIGTPLAPVVLSGGDPRNTDGHR